MEQLIDTLIITQARLGSTRLPKKVMLKIEGEELLLTHLKQLAKTQIPNQIIVATTTNETDNLIESKVKEWGFNCSRGSEDDVLDRFYQAAKPIQPKWVVRVTSDCPLIDPTIVDAVITFAKMNDVDYCSNGIIEHFPDGQDVEIFKFDALEKAWKEANLTSEREHVTPYIRNNADMNNGELFSAANLPSPANYSDIRMTVDEPKDFELLTKLIGELGTNKTWLEYTNYIIENNLQEINKSIIRNEGYLKSIKND